jgi:hypothetical protein
MCSQVVSGNLKDPEVSVKYTLFTNHDQNDHSERNSDAKKKDPELSIGVLCNFWLSC